MANDNAAGSTSGATNAPQDDVKAKFREALAAKQQKTADSDPNKNHVEQRFSTHGAEGGKRMFRRKSGG